MTLLSQLRRFRIARSGTTAVEFALIAPLFLGMTFTTFEAGGLLIRSMMLDRALDKAVRTVRVKGGVTTITQTQFRDSVCSGLLMFSSGCAQRLTVEMTVIKSASSFPSTAMTCVSKTAPNPTVNYATGARSDMVYVRTCLAVDPMLPIVATGLGLPRNESGQFSVMASGGFMNEP